MKYGIGIDTGGTFTDSVIVDLSERRLVSKAKALTTKQDLRIGIKNSLAALDNSLFPEVKLVSLSTTLATNSVVEGKGSRVGLIIAVPDENSFKLPANVPAEDVAVIRGAHDLGGNETAPLDSAAARKAVRRMKDRVDAFAVSGYFSIYNAAHELQLKELIAAECTYPVVCGHELSSGVGMVERAVTAALNASLLPVIGELLDAVMQIMAENNIHAPLMVVRGDGSLIGEKSARSRPVETVLSGPAASVIGACWLTGLSDAVVVDMGGTTSDIGVITGAIPAASEHGAVVGGWRTRVRSIDMWTAGLGGDSRMLVKSADEIHIGPRRVVPLSLASSQCPALNDAMRSLAATQGPALKALDLDFFMLVKMPAFAVGKYERLMLEALAGKVLHRADIEMISGPSVNLDQFVKLGFVAEVSFTPTDLLHVKGTLDLWDGSACEEAMKFYGNKTGLDREQLIALLFDKIIEKIKFNIAAKSLEEEGVTLPTRESRELLDGLLRLDGNGGITTSFKLNRPLVAVGAPVKAYFPQVASDLGAQLVVPEHAEVANAAGAVTGRVTAMAQVFVRPLRPVGFAVVAAGEHKVFDDVEPAIIYAEQLARTTAESIAAEAGGKNLATTVHTEEKSAPLASGWGKTILLELRITAMSIGQPYV